MAVFYRKADGFPTPMSMAATVVVMLLSSP